MAHKFDRGERDPYAEVDKQLDNNLFSDIGGETAGASEEIFGVLTDTIVASLGDIAAQAFRHGVNQPKQVASLAKAVSASCAAVFGAYQGEVDPEPALRAIASDPRADDLTQEVRDELAREIEKTRELEHRILSTRRLPELISFAGSLGLHVPDEALDRSETIVPGFRADPVPKG